MTKTEDGRASMPDPARAGAWSRRSARGHLLISLIRIFLITVVSVAVYVLAPLGSRPNVAVDAELTALLVGFAAVLVWEIRAVMKSYYPRLRAAEAVAVAVPLLILIFASAYFVTEQI